VGSENPPYALNTHKRSATFPDGSVMEPEDGSATTDLAIEETGSHDTPVLTVRSFAVGAAGAVFVSVADYVSGGVLQNSFIVGTQLGPIVVAFYLCLLLGNALLRRVAPSAAMSGNEILLSLAMVWVAAGVAAWGTVHGVLPGLVMPFRLALKSPVPWAEIVKDIPAWMVPSTDPDSAICADFENGTRTWGTVAWLPWARALALWAIAFGGLYGLVLSLGAICFRQWARSERLPFPVAQIPLSLIEAPEPGARFNRLLSSRAFWIGLGTVVFLGLLRGIHDYYPVVPEVARRWTLWQFYLVRPFCYMHPYMFDGYIFFSIIGVTLISPQHISLSIWLAFVLMQVYYVASYMLGVPPDSMGWKNWSAQSGGCIVYLGVLLYVGRVYYADVLRAFASSAHAAAHDLRRERAWAWAAFLSCAVIVGWFKAAGLPLWTCLLLTFLMTLIFIILMRMLAESGLLYMQLDFRPSTYVVELFHGRGLSHQQAAISMMTTPLCLEQRDHPTLAAHTSMYCNSGPDWRPRRGFFFAIVAAMALAYVAASAAGLLSIYRYGSFHVDRWCTIAPDALGTPAWHALRMGRSGASFTAATAGAIIVGWLSFMRLHFTWWPLHPVGFLIGITYPGARIWSNVAIGWFLKWGMIRYGGTRMVSVAKHLGIGIIIGEAVIQMFWVLVGTAVWLGGGEAMKVEFSYY